jgi:hypothetical protein
MTVTDRVFVITEILNSDIDIELPIIIRSKEDIIEVIKKFEGDHQISTKLNTINIDDIKLHIERVVPIATELDLDTLLS